MAHAVAVPDACGSVGVGDDECVAECPVEGGLETIVKDVHEVVETLGILGCGVLVADTVENGRVLGDLLEDDEGCAPDVVPLQCLNALLSGFWRLNNKEV